MNKNLLIVGAGIYAVVASEIAADTGLFDKVDFVDDMKKETPTGSKVIGTTDDLTAMATNYDSIVVAIGNPKVRLAMLERIKAETSYQIVSLVSPRAYISPSAQVKQGCIVEPMAVVQSGCVIGEGCIISAGAVVNHASICFDGVHVDCNATVDGYCNVPSGLKICSGEVFRKESSLDTNDVRQDISKQYSKEIDGLEYTFESGM